MVIRAQPRYMGSVGAALARRHDGAGPADPPWFMPWAKEYAWGGETIEVTALEMPPELYGQGFTLVAGPNGTFGFTDAKGTELAKGQTGVPLVVSLGRDLEMRLIVGKLVAREGTEFTITRIETKDAADWLRGSMRVVERGSKGAFIGSGILELTLRAGAPQLAANIANAIAQAYLRQNVDRLSQAAERKLEFLNSQLPRLQGELASAEQALLEQRSKSGPYQLSEGAKSILESLTGIEKEISELELQRAELSQTLTAAHPAMTAVVRKLSQLEIEKARINARIAQLPDAEARLLQLTRDSKVAGELYISLLNKAQELKVAKAGTIGNVHIVDTAVPVNYRVEPKAQRMLVTWTAMGIAAGLFAVFLRKHLNVTLVWAEDAEKKIGIPVYATIPFSSRQTEIDRGNGKSTLLAEVEPRDIAVESLRSLRASLHFAMMEAKRNLVVITGSTPNVGKSFVASNLAKLIADAGKRVLLVDADMRKGRIHRIFGFDRKPGLSEVISGKATLKEVAHQIGDSPFVVVTTGQLPPNPSELLASDKFVSTIEAACHEYDIVIVDTPPILNLADTVVVSKSAGAVFVTIRGGVSTVPDVQDCVQRFAKNGIRVDGLIFNGLRPGVGSYVHPQYYHYRYRYSRYGTANH